MPDLFVRKEAEALLDEERKRYRDELGVEVHNGDVVYQLILEVRRLRRIESEMLAAHAGRVVPRGR